ncbi:hypothetical protein [Actinobacillus pleuropneumoniae]|uniref:hypothetical protein n=1 Tax=Actinobacillus pleuropneumoniae TaxID=715 RepID=UPI0001DF77BF|nr:hypothetical protein [Actinobacillus pleuropneumoniae]EFL80270.1 hypothetical protein APP6_0389 [Actinobacillus pleuropneumoniae serovar 6 str. Femo]UKH11433.1 hypothetical protein D1099_05885 [Actinobacillus pleuropneumoniae serovar 6 str. Femo]SUU64255.1 Uncharacterised protein [Actinobacillus pleuropneumoniae]
MPIKFPDLLQDSWNFIRNQHTFSLLAVILLSALQFVNLFLVPRIANMDAENVEMTLSDLFPLLILNIKEINRGSFKHFFQNLSGALAKLFPVILLNIIMVLPLSIGMASQVFGAKAGGGLSMIAFPLIIGGAFLFIKLCLSVYAYLIEELNSVNDAIRFTWQLSRGRGIALVLFCVISYFVPQILMSFLSGLSGNTVGLIVSVLVSSFFSLFITVFSFRFYQAYSQNSVVRG